MTKRPTFKRADACLSQILGLNHRAKMVIFDLDDTLYPEADYLLPAFRQFALKYVRGDKAESVCSFLTNEYFAGRRAGIFDRAAEQFQLRPTLATFLRVLRYENTAHLTPYAGAYELIARLRSAGLIASVATNGNPAQQMRKLHLLQRNGMPDDLPYVLCDLFARKPDPSGLMALLGEANLGADQCVMIGDAVTDRQAAESAGVIFMDVRKLFR